MRLEITRYGRHGARGFAMVAALLVTFTALAITTAFLYRAELSSREAGSLVDRRRAFYVVDGMSRIVIREVQNYMRQNPDPSTEDLTNPENIPFPAVEGYVPDKFELESSGAAFDGPIPNGPFEGMYGHQKPIQIDLHALKGTEDLSGQVHLRVTLAQVSLFQFFIFGDGYTEIFPGPNMTINPGRVHSNADLCLGSSNTFKLERVTAASRVLSADGRCIRTAGTGSYLWDKSRYVLMNSNNSSGCTNCGGSGTRWQAYALSTWKGNVRDSAHGVPRLRLPIAGTARAQAGMNAAGVKMSNENKLRILLDPVSSTDTEDTLSQKFAQLADLRIINGVWYKNNGSWPGQPIWSDHPGSFTTTNEEGMEGTPRAVGQRDLKTALGWTSTPRRYSYYEYDEIQKRLADDTLGILSYGMVFRSSGPVWKPGFLAKGASSTTYVDVDGKSKVKFCSHCSNASCTAAQALRLATTPFCQAYSSGAYQSLPDAQLLQAARSGFIDQRVRSADTTRGAILPINFDLAEFTAALADTTPGELGSYFGGGSSFNGIVYISATWSGSMAGMPNSSASLWPAQGSISDAPQIQNNSVASVQTALPFPLCSTDLGYQSGSRRIGFSRPASDGVTSNGFEPLFTIPSCTSDKSTTARPNAIRILNGASVSTTRFPKGLSIVSNLPVYVQGNLNSSSVTSSQTVTPWVPVMVGSDALTLLSNAWDDKNSLWDNTVAYTTRVASASTFTLCFLGGMVETADANRYSGGMENFPRFLENWTGVTATIAGSFVYGFSSIYQRQPWKYGSPVYDAPNRTWFFDPHLTVLDNQPPGAPRFSIHSVSRLNRL